MWTRGAAGARSRAWGSRRGGWRHQRRTKTENVNNPNSSNAAAPKAASRSGIAKKLVFIVGGATLTYAGAHALISLGDQVGVPENIRDAARATVQHVDAWALSTATSVHNFVWSSTPNRVSATEDAVSVVPQTATTSAPVPTSAEPTDVDHSETSNAFVLPVMESAHDSDESSTAHISEPAQHNPLSSSDAADIVAFVLDSTRVDQALPDEAATEPATAPPLTDADVEPTAEPISPVSEPFSLSADMGPADPSLPNSAATPAPTLEQHLELKELTENLQQKYNELKDMLGEQTQMEAARIREIIRQYESNFQRYLSDQELQHSNVQREQARLFESHLQELRVEVASALSTVSQSARSRHNERLESIYSTLKELQTLQESFQKLVVRSKDESCLLNVARVSLLLQRHLADHPSLPFDSLLKELQASSRDIPTLFDLARSIPVDVAAQGLPSLDALRAEFERTASQARRATFTAPSSSLFDNLLAILREKVTPEHQKVGLVSGNDNWSKLARANWFIRNGKLEAAVSEVDSMDGQPRDLMIPFVTKARDAVAVSHRLRLLSIATANALRQ